MRTAATAAVTGFHRTAFWADHEQMDGKIFITASELLQDSFRLAAQIHRSGFRPDFIIGIWRGGTPVGIAIQEYFEYVGVRPDHIAVRTSAYVGIGEHAKTIRVHGLHYIVDEAGADDSLLIVDDVFDSGHSIEALLAGLTLDEIRSGKSELAPVVDLLQPPQATR